MTVGGWIPRYKRLDSIGELMSEKPTTSLAAKLPSFQALADEAKKAAEEATSPEMRDAYEALAQGWDQLIGEIKAMNDTNRPNS